MRYHEWSNEQLTEEENKLIANGFISVSLGKTVFRTETASLVALSYINYQLMR